MFLALDGQITSATRLHFTVIVECLIGIFTSKRTTDKELHQNIMNILRTNNLDVNKIINQSHGRARNTNGSEQGWQMLVQKACAMASYLHLVPFT